MAPEDAATAHASGCRPRDLPRPPGLGGSRTTARRRRQRIAQRLRTRELMQYALTQIQYALDVVGASCTGSESACQPIVREPTTTLEAHSNVPGSYGEPTSDDNVDTPQDDAADGRGSESACEPIVREPNAILEAHSNVLDGQGEPTSADNVDTPWDAGADAAEHEDLDPPDGVKSADVTMIDKATPVHTKAEEIDGSASVASTVDSTLDECCQLLCASLRARGRLTSTEALSFLQERGINEFAARRVICESMRRGIVIGYASPEVVQIMRRHRGFLVYAQPDERATIPFLASS